MTAEYTPLLWVVPILMGAMYAAYRLRSSRLTRPATRKETKTLAGIANQAYSSARDVVRATVTQIQHDGLTRRVRLWIARAAQAVAALAEHDARAERLAEERSTALRQQDEYIEAQRSAGEEAPYLGHRSAAGLNTILLIGDITIVSMAIQANDATAGLFVSTAGSLALAAALFVLGKLLADTLRQIYGRRSAAAVVTVGIGAFSAGLYLLRLGYVEAWVVLATAPAIAATGVSLLGPSRSDNAVRRAKKASAKTGKRHEAALRKRSRITGRVEYMLTRARLALVANGYRASSVAQMAGIEDAVTSLEAIASELGISLGHEFRHRPAAKATLDPLAGPSEMVGEASIATEDEYTTEVPSNGEGSHDVALEDAPAFVPERGNTNEEEQP